MIFNRRVNASINVNKTIPDNSPGGLTSTFNCQLPGQVVSAQFSVDISHKSVGQLSVMLAAPSGKQVMVHNRAGGSRNDLKETYIGGSMRNFDGEEAAGLWTVTVIDSKGRQTGTLNSWNLDMQLRRIAAEPTAYLAEVGKHLTSGASNALASTLKVPLSSVAAGAHHMSIILDMDRTYLTDITVTLALPSGRRVDLHTCKGWTKRGERWSLPATSFLTEADAKLDGNYILTVSGEGKKAYGRLARWGVSFAPIADLQLEDGAAKQALSSVGLATQQALTAAIPLEVTSILAIKGHQQAAQSFESLGI